MVGGNGENVEWRGRDERGDKSGNISGRGRGGSMKPNLKFSTVIGLAHRIIKCDVLIAYHCSPALCKTAAM